MFESMIGAQACEARQLLGWTRLELATRCRLHEGTIRIYEETGRMPKSMFRRTNPEDRLANVQSVLEAAGVEFTNGDTPGVKLWKAER